MLVQFHKKNLKNDNYEFLHMAFIESNQQAIETMEHIDFNILDVGDIIWPEIMIVARPTDDAWIGIDQLDSYNADQVKLGIKKYLNDKRAGTFVEWKAVEKVGAYIISL